MSLDVRIFPLLSGYIIVYCLWIRGAGGADTAFMPTASALTSARRIKINKGWQSFKNSKKEYIFILDSDYLLDLTRTDAKRNCMSKNGDLVSLESEEELHFVQDEIRTQVQSLGQRLGEEEWWTNGMSYRQLKWIWDTPVRPQVNISALRRSTVPRNGPHFLALTHPGGWRLQVVPGNYKLRYVCERNKTEAVPSPSLVDESSEMYTQVSDSLQEELFGAYDGTRPPYFSKEKDEISLAIALQPIQDNITRDKLHITQDVITRWVDPRLSWASMKYDRIPYLQANIRRVWYPNISDSQHGHHQRITCNALASNSIVTIDSTGAITLERTCDVTYNCTLQKSSAFPFDHQYCRLMMLVQDAGAKIKISWGNAADTGNRFQRAWTVSSLNGGPVDGFEKHVPADISVVQITLYLHRNVMYHVLTLLVPCLFLSLVLLILLWLPHGSGLKCVATFLVTVTFLLYLGLGGRHRENHSVSYSDMYMVVMAIIGSVALITQICILRLISRHRKHIPPPSWVEKVVINRSQKTMEKSFRERQCKDLRVVKKQEFIINKNIQSSKWIEEKELMLGDQPLGMTSLGRDARVPPHYVTHIPDSRGDGYSAPQVVINNRTCASHKPLESHSTAPNGTTNRHLANKSRYLNPSKYKETSFFTKKDGDKYTDEIRELADISAGESFDSGCHSATKNSPDITMSTTQSIKDSQWKKCIVWFDRAVSLVISAAVIFTIMIFTILFLAT